MARVAKLSKAQQYELGRRIKGRREELGYSSQEQLAEALGVARGTVANWERGRHGVGDDIIDKLQNILQVDAGFFDMGGSNKPSSQAYLRIKMLEDKIEFLTFKIDMYLKEISEDFIKAYIKAPDEKKRHVNLVLGLEAYEKQDDGLLDDISEEMQSYMDSQKMPPVKKQNTEYIKTATPNEEARLKRLSEHYESTGVDSPHLTAAWEAANKFEKLRWINFQRKMLGMPEDANIETIKSGFDIELYERFLELSPEDQEALTNTTFKYLGINPKADSDQNKEIG